MSEDFPNVMVPLHFKISNVTTLAQSFNQQMRIGSLPFPSTRRAHRAQKRDRSCSVRQIATHNQNSWCCFNDENEERGEGYTSAWFPNLDEASPYPFLSF